jgi:antitoxin (DNA-binding transcriptional repressor) of toxin-antitoxin stability system
MLWPGASFCTGVALRKMRSYVKYGMDIKVSATDLARKLGDVLGRIRYRGDSFVVERNGEAVARVVPLVERPTATLGELLMAWGEAGPADPDFARDLAEVDAADSSQEDPWGS